MTATDGKEQEDFTLTPPARSKPTLTQVGNRFMASDARFHPELAAKYIINHGGRERRLPMGELARVFYGGNTPSNKKRIRQRMWRINFFVLQRGFLLVVEIDPRLGAQSCKIYDPRSVEDQRYVDDRLMRMKNIGILKQSQYCKALELKHELDATVADESSTSVVTGDDDGVSAAT